MDLAALGQLEQLRTMAQSDEPLLPFWFGEREGATAAELAAAEEYLGYRLPTALRELLQEQNGGVSNFAAYEKAGFYYPLLPLFGVDPNAGAGTLMRAFDVNETFEVPSGIVMFAGEGHAWWGLDYRRNADRPAIVYRNSEDEPIEEVTGSFEELLQGLVAG